MVLYGGGIWETNNNYENQAIKNVQEYQTLSFELRLNDKVTIIFEIITNQPLPFGNKMGN